MPIDSTVRASTSVLLVQLGTPDSPDVPAVRRYLREFLSDPRVVELPRAVWLPILHGLVLPLRPKRSAAKYQSIWTPDGSPLKVNTVRQAKLLRGYLGELGHHVEVMYAMRYGNPSVPSILRRLRDKGLRRLLVVPMYPQYSASTTASVYDAVWAELSQWRSVPETRLVGAFYDRPDLITAQARRIEVAWSQSGRPDKLVMSFHGLPQRSVDQGDPYQQQCLETARLLADRLRLSEDQYVVTFQSRFGKARWLQPYTSQVLAELAARKVGRVDVVCPGFVADCLETLEEIAIEGRHDFLAAGGAEFNYLECLNDAPDMIRSLTSLVSEQLAGWQSPVPQAVREEAAALRL